uniref:Peptidyl-prolyl cis-trans isomerase n=1 Tax=Ascaris lumbricoides TaxID=6252 RepID=A0A9J2PMF8_ASCLU
MVSTDEMDHRVVQVGGGPPHRPLEWGSYWVYRANYCNRSIRLSAHILPKICENFRSLCTGEKESDLGFEYTYKGTHLHLINRNQKVLVGGDIVNRNGSGGYSIYGRSFDDKPKQIDYHRRGVLFMLTQGAKSNKVDSQFFICLDIPKATNDGIAFGYVEEGLRVLESVLQYGDANGVPRKKIVIYDCGQLILFYAHCIIHHNRFIHEHNNWLYAMNYISIKLAYIHIRKKAPSSHKALYMSCEVMRMI